ncbi:MAG TPA: hypothetical protein VMW72_05595, partial [Sedimentisphaerales bacterium]|nr:hypothetical protein [Sedimentisphaerales bacterium]
RVKLGGQLRVEADLIDPKLDIIIRRLEDTTRKQKKEYLTSNGQKRTLLFPTIAAIITPVEAVGFSALIQPLTATYDSRDSDTRFGPAAARGGRVRGAGEPHH